MKSLHDRRRYYVCVRILSGTALAIIIWTVLSFLPFCDVDDPICHLSLPAPYFENDWIQEPGPAVVNTGREHPEHDEEHVKMQSSQDNQLQSTFSSTPSPALGHPRIAGETSFLAYAAGFSVIENAYWRNDTWYLITSKPWSFPPIELVVSNAPDHGQEAVTDDKVVQVLNWQQAKEAGLLLDAVEAVDGTSLIFNDRIYLDHFYHVVGEMFLGAFRVLASMVYDPAIDAAPASPTTSPRSVLDQLPEISRLVFAHIPSKTLFDHAGLNKFFFGRFFPTAAWEFEPEWQARADSGVLYRFDRVVIADRKCGHLGGGKGKPMDLAFELPVPAGWVADLKTRVLESYDGPVSLEDHEHVNSKPVITYLSRQNAAHRRLKEESHDELVAALRGLEEEGLAEVYVEEFTDADPKDEQVAKLSRTTILVGLHGNGLTNLIWMTPDPRGRSTVYEIQQKGMFFDDYQVLSEALNIEHWIYGGRSDLEYCQRSTCGIRGTDDDLEVGWKHFTVDVPDLLHRIRGRLLLASDE